MKHYMFEIVLAVWLTVAIGGTVIAESKWIPFVWLYSVVGAGLTVCVTERLE